MVSKRINPFIKTVFLLGIWAAPVRGQERIGSPPNSSDKAHPVPVQTYAVIDVSGSAATSPVGLVALNDNNQMAFGFPAGQPIDTVTDHRQYQVGLWKNGQTTLLPAFDTAQSLSNDPENWRLTTITCLTPTGATYGNTSDWEGGYHYDSTSIAVGCPALPNPPYQGVPGGVSAASEAGYIFGTGWIRYQGQGGGGSPSGFLASPDGQFTLFQLGNTYYPQIPPLAGSVAVQQVTFYASQVNNHGQLLGWQGNSDGTSVQAYWDGSSLTPFSSYRANDLNDQGQVVLYTLDTNGAALEGSLWDGGGQYTALASQLPKAIAGQLQKIIPFSISNQAVPAPAANADATIHILATAKDNGADVTVLCTRDNAEAWTFAEIQLPQGVTITDFTTINSSGIIAATGNAGTGDGHALLLVPAQLTVVNIGPIDGAKSTWDDRLQSNGNGTSHITGLQSPWFSIKAVLTNLPGININAIIKQDINTVVHYAYYDGSSSVYDVGYVPDNDPPYDGSSQSTPNGDGTTTVKYNPQPRGYYGDAPSLGMDYGTPARQRLLRCIYHSDVRDFLVISVNGGSDQVTAEANWSIDMEAYFLPPNGNDNSIFSPASPPFIPNPVLNATNYGTTRGDSGKPISDRSKVAGQYINQTQYWHGKGKQGSIGVTYPCP